MTEPLRIGVLSDTHGELENLRSALEALHMRSTLRIIHLGDDYKDVDAIEIPKEVEIIRVPGVFEEIYRKPDTTRRIIKEFNEWRTLITHTEAKHENDPQEETDPQELISRGAVDVILHGHSHIPRIQVYGRVVHVNPGHLKSQDRKGYPPTYAIIDFYTRKIEIEIYTLKTNTLYSKLTVYRGII